MFDVEKEEEVKDIKLHLRVDSNFSDSEIKRMVRAAQFFLMGEIGNDQAFYEKDGVAELFNIATLFLTDHYYKTRSATTSLKFSEVPYSIQSIVLSLKAEYLLYKKRGESNGIRTT